MKLRKGWVALAASAVIAGSAAAQGIGVNVNGQPVTFNGVGPQQVQGRVMVPLRGVMERLGAYVSYNPNGRIVTATRGDVDLQLRLGERVATVNGRQVSLDVPAQEYRGSTLVPLRFMGEALGADVRWDAAAQAVNISTQDAGAQDPNNYTPPRPGGGTGSGTTTPGELAINSFTADQEGYLRAGSRVTYTLEGSPGGKAALQIPGLTDEIEMREVSPGRYQATYAVPTGTTTTGRGSAIARLRVGTRERLIQSAAAVQVDNQGPVIGEVTPGVGDRVTRRRPTITATLQDAGSGIERESVRLTLDGRDVTNDVTITNTFLTFRPDEQLAPGKHTAVVTARDKAGNQVSKSWEFNVVTNADVIKTFNHNADQRLAPGQVLTFTLTGEPGGTATYTVGKKLVNRAMVETEPGRYVAEYTVRTGDDFNNEPVTATLRTKAGETFTSDAQVNVAAKAGPPAAPVISSPTAADAAGRNVVVRGKAGKRARVLVRIDYQARALGVLAFNGTLGEQIVEADDAGLWETKAFNLETLGTGRGTTYTITATTLGTGDENSEPARVQIKR